MNIDKKKITIILLVILIFGGYTVVKNRPKEMSPVSEIEVKNDTVYLVTDEIKAEDFDVIVHREDGTEEAIKDVEEPKLSTSIPEKVGSTTAITYTCKIEGKEFSAVTKVNTAREKLVSFQCGTPNLSDVKAVLYSNGELCFEGKGDIRRFNEYPWVGFQSENNVVVTSIAFNKEVEPTSLDGFFANMECLAYVDRIPESVQSMRYAFANCISLTVAPDFSKNEKLIDATGCFSGCSSLTKISSLPKNVKIANEYAYECSALENIPDMTTAESLTDADFMFSGCTAAISPSMPNNLVSAISMYENCMNLMDMPKMPESIQNMQSCFAGCSSMKTIQDIPRNVVNVSRCFEGCTALTGKVVFKGEPIEYSGCFDGVALAGTLTVSTTNEEMGQIFAEDNSHVKIAKNKK